MRANFATLAGKHSVQQMRAGTFALDVPAKGPQLPAAPGLLPFQGVHSGSVCSCSSLSQALGAQGAAGEGWSRAAGAVAGCLAPGAVGAELCRAAGTELDELETRCRTGSWTAVTPCISQHMHERQKRGQLGTNTRGCLGSRQSTHALMRPGTAELVTGAVVLAGRATAGPAGMCCLPALALVARQCGLYCQIPE